MRKKIMGFCDQGGVQYMVGETARSLPGGKKVAWINWSGRPGEPIEIGLERNDLRLEFPYNTITWIAYQKELTSDDEVD